MNWSLDLAARASCNRCGCRAKLAGTENHFLGSEELTITINFCGTMVLMNQTDEQHGRILYSARDPQQGSFGSLLARCDYTESRNSRPHANLRKQ